jgi:hypothetical protein
MQSGLTGDLQGNFLPDHRQFLPIGTPVKQEMPALFNP